MPLISASLAICEKILNEADGVLSTIRIVDLFSLPALGQEQTGVVKISALATAKFDPDDTSEHTGALLLIRPDGESKEMQTITAHLSELEMKYPGTPRGFNIVAAIDVVAQQMGTHFLVFLVDGQEAARTAFTIVQTPPGEETQTPD